MAEAEDNHPPRHLQAKGKRRFDAMKSSIVVDDGIPRTPGQTQNWRSGDMQVRPQIVLAWCICIQYCWMA